MNLSMWCAEHHRPPNQRSSVTKLNANPLTEVCDARTGLAPIGTEGWRERIARKVLMDFRDQHALRQRLGLLIHLRATQSPTPRRLRVAWHVRLPLASWLRVLRQRRTNHVGELQRCSCDLAMGETFRAANPTSSGP